MPVLEELDKLEELEELEELLLELDELLLKLDELVSVVFQKRAEKYRDPKYCELNMHQSVASRVTVILFPDSSVTAVIRTLLLFAA